MSTAKILILLSLISAGVLIYFSANKIKGNGSPDLQKARINGKTFNLEVSDTEQKRSRGLSGRENMPENRGMIFRFDTKGVYTFWMKDMNFPLDFVWLDGDTVSDISENIPPPPDNQPENMTYIAPKTPIDSVIEFNAGTVKELEIKNGDKIEYIN